MNDRDGGRDSLSTHAEFNILHLWRTAIYLLSWPCLVSNSGYIGSEGVNKIVELCRNDWGL